MIERQLDQMVRLVDDPLDMSRITRGKFELRKAVVQLSAVIESAVQAESGRGNRSECRNTHGQSVGEFG